jgi:hypothetical protein
MPDLPQNGNDVLGLDLVEPQLVQRLADDLHDALELVARSLVFQADLIGLPPLLGELTELARSLGAPLLVVALLFRVGSFGEKSQGVDRLVLGLGELNPPPPELRPIGYELAFCQRYYRQTIGSTNGEPTVYGYGAAGQAMGTSITFPVPMRATPAISSSGTWAVANCAQPTISASDLLPGIFQRDRACHRFVSAERIRQGIF